MLWAEFLGDKEKCRGERIRIGNLYGPKEESLAQIVCPNYPTARNQWFWAIIEMISVYKKQLMMRIAF